MPRVLGNYVAVVVSFLYRERGQKKDPQKKEKRKKEKTKTCYLLGSPKLAVDPFRLARHADSACADLCRASPPPSLSLVPKRDYGGGWFY